MLVGCVPLQPATHNNYEFRFYSLVVLSERNRNKKNECKVR